MRALLFDGTAVKFRQYQADPVAGPDEALIKVEMAGVCQTDLEISQGYMSFKGVLGHEFVGTVLKCKEGKWVGKRVVGEINCVCGKCDMCQRGLSTHCRHRSVLGISNKDGVFADLVALPMRNLHEVPPNVSLEEAVFVEPLAAAVQVLRQVQIDARTKVTVLGDGRLGQLVAQVVHRHSKAMELIGRHGTKLAIAERLGIPTRLERELQPRRDQDVVIDCTGRVEGLERALTLVRPRGTVVLKTTVVGSKPMNLAGVVIDEITILGSRCGPFADALALLGQKQVDVACLVSRRTRLEAAEGLFAPGGAGWPSETLKMLLTFDR